MNPNIVMFLKDQILCAGRFSSAALFLTAAAFSVVTAAE